MAMYDLEGGEIVAIEWVLCSEQALEDEGRYKTRRGQWCHKQPATLNSRFRYYIRTSLRHINPGLFHCNTPQAYESLLYLNIP